MYCTGAGDGQFGIWFDQDLNHGRTQACQTFDNPPLAASEDFRWSNLPSNIFS